jgi:methanogenic corrinoid protein MtbC1
VTTLAHLRAEAVDSVVAALHDRHPGLAERLGARGQQACKEDIAHHVDCLDGALLADEPALFVDYAVWHQTVLCGRTVPVRHLAESFELLDTFLSARLPAAGAGRASAMLGAARDALGRTDLPAPCLHARLPALQAALQYSAASLRGNQREAQQLMSAAMQGGHTLSEASVRLVQPAMVEVGRLWQDNRVTVAQEHLATAISQSVLARAYLEADFAAPNGRKAMFANVAGNHHSLGLRMLSDAFETVGWEVSFLGADLPIADLIRHADGERPELICLSLSLPSHLAVARESAERLRAELGNACPTIWVGGQATLVARHVWRSVGADGWAADAVHAVEQAA